MANIVLIPARGGSKGIKLKNIYPILDKPMIFYALDASTKAKKTDKIYVATDSPEIKETVLNFNFPKVEIYNRKEENAKDDSKTIDLILEFIENAKINYNDTLILIQATSPLIENEILDKMIEEYMKDTSYSMLSTTVQKGFFWTREGKPILHNPKIRLRRQEIEYPILKENGAVYINSVKNILDEKSLLTKKVKPYIMPEDYALEIDELKDIKQAETILWRRKNEKR